MLVRAYGKPARVRFSSPGLSAALDRLGASAYALQSLVDTSVAGGTPTFTLISSSDSAFTKTLTGKSVFFTSVHSQQKQNGYVHGVITRNQKGLFEPVVSAQELPQSVVSVQTMDFSFFQVAWAPPTPWPYMDTPARVSAYRYLSFEILNTVFHLPKNSAHLEDIRYDYTGSQNATLANKPEVATSITMPAMTSGCVADPAQVFQGVNPANVENLCFGEQDFSQVQTQLFLELQSLRPLIAFFGNAADGTGLGGEILGAASGITTPMFSAIAKVYGSWGSSSARVDINPADQLNLAAGIAAIPGVFCPPIGMLSGVLWTASALVSLSTDSSPTEIPGWFTGYLADLNDLTQNSNKYVRNLQEGFDTALDNIYSDWGKLSTVNSKVLPGGIWYQRDQIKNFPSFTYYESMAASRYAYLQLVPKFYSLDNWPAQNSADPSQIASSFIVCGIRTCNSVCFTPYTRSFLQANPDIAYSRIALSDFLRYDIFVIGGTLSYNGSRNVSEEFPSPDLLSTLFGSNPEDLNFPKDLFFASNGPLLRRAGPSYGGNACSPPQNNK